MATIQKDINQIIHTQELFQVYLNKLEADKVIYGEDKELEPVQSINKSFKQLIEILKEAKSAQETAEEIKLIEAIRLNLSKLMANEKKSRLTTDFFNSVFSTQIMLALFWPVNKKTEDGKYEDPILLTEIEGGETFVVTSSGHWFDKENLNNYFSRNNAFVIKNGQAYVRSPFHEILSEREIEQLKNSGIKIPRPDLNLLAVNRAFGLGGERIDGGMDPEAQAQLQRRNRNLYLAAGVLRGAVIGISIGATLGYLITLALVVIAPPLPLAGLAVLFGLGALTGIVENLRGTKNFWSSVINSVFTNALLISVTALVAPQLLLGLASASIISSATAAAASASMPLILSCVPVVSFLAASVVECLKPGGMVEFYDRIRKIPTQLTAITLAVVGGLGGLIISGVYSFFKPPLVIPPQQQININENPLLSNEAAFNPGQRGIMQGLGVNPRVVNYEEEKSENITEVINVNNEDQSVPNELVSEVVIDPIRPN